MRLRRPRIRLEWIEFTTTNVMFLAVIVAIGFVIAARWSKGSSILGFESPYWDLGLIPILSALVVGAFRFERCDAIRRRFILGFEIFGLAAVAGYIVSCSRPARWSLVSALLPFQTGLMLAPDVGMSWTSLKLWQILVDTAILTSLPLVAATVGGAIFSVRFTMRRIVVGVAVIALVLGGLVGILRRIRRYDELGAYHRDQIVCRVRRIPRADGTLMYLLEALDPSGKPVTPYQYRIDEWHMQMSERYWRAASHPWLDVKVDPPPRE